MSGTKIRRLGIEIEVSVNQRAIPPKFVYDFDVDPEGLGVSILFE